MHMLTAPYASVDTNEPTTFKQNLQLIFKGEIYGFIKQRAIVEDNIQKAYSLVLIQFIDLLQSNIKQYNQWAQSFTAQDII